MSFDPEFDTPEQLKLLESGNGHEEHAGHGEHAGHEEHAKSEENAYTLDWKYLTTLSNEQLAPILESYNQSVIPQASQNGENSGNFSHILRVFLIDPEMRIRNIYSVSFLHPDIIINDVKTLLLESSAKAKLNDNDQKEHLP